MLENYSINVSRVFPNKMYELSLQIDVPVIESEQFTHG